MIHTLTPHGASHVPTPLLATGDQVLFPACEFTNKGDLPPLPPVPATIPVEKPNPAPTSSPGKVPSRDKIFPTRKLALTPEEVNKEITLALEKEECFPKHAPIKHSIGKTMLPRNFALTHPAANLITEWADNGCPVDCGDDWTYDHIITALKRGPHKSAKSKEAIQALQDETNEKVKSGYARVVKWRDIKICIPPKLKLSP